MAKKIISKKEKELITLTPDEKFQKLRERELTELRKISFLMPNPTYKFEIGDNADFNGMSPCVVKAVYDNYTIYEVDCIEYDKSKKVEKASTRWVQWFKLRKPTESDNEELANDTGVELFFAQTPISTLLHKSYEMGVDFNPDYQRDYVWELEDKVELIDSIFNRIDIGKFVFVENDYVEKYEYEILDGKQRLRAILDFYEDRFAYKGRYFSDLSKKDKVYFMKFTIPHAIVNFKTKKDKLLCFIKLNTAGKVIDYKHLDKIKKLYNSIA